MNHRTGELLIAASTVCDLTPNRQCLIYQANIGLTQQEWNARFHVLKKASKTCAEELLLLRVHV